MVKSQLLRLTDMYGLTAARMLLNVVGVIVSETKQ